MLPPVELKWATLLFSCIFPVLNVSGPLPSIKLVVPAALTLKKLPAV